MAVTAYNLKSTSSSSGTLLNHQNTSGGVERVIINYIRTKDSSLANGYMNMQFGPSSDLINLQIAYSRAFGKNVAYIGEHTSSLVFQGQGWQGHSGVASNELTSAPTEIMLADQEYFKITWYGSYYIYGCNIVVIPEGG